MVSIKSYLLSNFTKSFLTVFLPFFLIVSLIFLVRIARLTSTVQMEFYELATLYSFYLPDIFFYTIPISFIAAITNLFIRLSQDNELIALYSVGLKSKEIVNYLLTISLLFSTLLLTISLLIVPISKQSKNAFIMSKKSSTNINIVPGETGQKFGSFYIYAEDKVDNDLKNVIIYNRSDRTNEQFFAATNGHMNTQHNITSLVLNDGFGYTYNTNSLQQADYDELEVFQNAKSQDFIFENLISYWLKVLDHEKHLHKLLFNIFVSLIPILSLFLVASFTIINPRYQKARSFIIIFSTTILLYFIASSLQKFGTVTMLASSIVTIIIVGKIMFRRNVTRYF